MDEVESEMERAVIIGFAILAGTTVAVGLASVFAPELLRVVMRQLGFL